MVGEGRQVVVETPDMHGLDGLRNAAVQSHPPGGGECVVEGAAHEGMGEAVAADRPGHLEDQASRRCLLDGREEILLVQGLRPLEHGQLELGPDDRRHPQDAVGFLRQAGESPLASRTSGSVSTSSKFARKGAPTSTSHQVELRRHTVPVRTSPGLTTSLKRSHTARNSWGVNSATPKSCASAGTEQRVRQSHPQLQSPTRRHRHF
jgi:hypothetical protein